MAVPHPSHAPDTPTGVLVLADGRCIYGRGFGAEGEAVGELCFHTAITGYQEIMTDPSFAGQIITFTFPHIGNVGVNAQDVEAHAPHALGMIVRQDVTAPSNFRATGHLNDWLKAHGRIGLSGIDTRALTRLIRLSGAPNVVLAHHAEGVFDIPALVAKAKGWAGLEGMDLAKDVTTAHDYTWGEGPWTLDDKPRAHKHSKPKKVIALDYGIKQNILRNLVAAGCDVTILPANASFAQIMAHAPDGLFLSNGPGDPAATGAYAVGVIQQWLATKKPLFGICLGHQLLALAVGAKTVKMHQGHRGANHPVQRLDDKCVEITSMNHGFTVDAATLPANARATHISLFDGSNCGFELVDQPAFSVQYHPEASPGPMDSLYLFKKFVEMM
jgi:carbamoyl-phosphate synthase small subunit